MSLNENGDGMDLILAQDRGVVLDSIRRGFAQPEYGIVGVLLVLFLLALLAFIAVFFVVKRREELRLQLDDPAALFQELAMAHSLGAEERDLLTRLAAVAGLERGDLIFARPDLFDAALSDPAIVASIPDQAMVDRLRANLFSH